MDRASPPTFPLPDCPQDHKFYRREPGPFPFSLRPRTAAEVKTLAEECLFYWLHRLLLVTQITAKPQHFHPKTPYHIIPIIKGEIPEEMLWFMWALTVQYDCAIIVPGIAMYRFLCDKSFSGTNLEKLLKMFAPIPFWRGKLFSALTDHDVWNVPDRLKHRFYYAFVLRRLFAYRNEILYTRNNFNIVGYSKIWPTDEKHCLNNLAKHLTFHNNPNVDVLTGAIEGLSLPSEEEASSSKTIQEELREFQSNFLASSVIYPTPPLHQNEHPWNSPLVDQTTYGYENIDDEEPGSRVYPLLPSPTYVDAGIEDDDTENQYTEGPHNLVDNIDEHEPITKYSP
ncbi:hypothetical protein S245_032163 [Arachis hypogaea]